MYADWCFVESLGSVAYDFNGACVVPSETQLAAMMHCSPVRHVGAVRAPTLICIGLRDRRVPPSQGIEYYHLLRSRGVVTR